MFFKKRKLEVRSEIRFGDSKDTNLYRFGNDKVMFRGVDGKEYDVTDMYPNAPAKPVDHYALATVTAERVIQSGVLLLGFYYAASTLREVAIHTAKVKIK